MKPKTVPDVYVGEVARRRASEVRDAEGARKSVLVDGPAVSEPLRPLNAVKEHPTRTKPAPPVGARIQSVEAAVDWWSRPRGESP